MATKYFMLLVIILTGIFLLPDAATAQVCSDNSGCPAGFYCDRPTSFPGECRPLGCTESWSCTAWGPCTNNHQSRSCTDANACGTTNNMPPVVQECQPAPVCGNGVCESGESASTCPQDCQTPGPSLPSATTSLGTKNPAHHNWFYNESSPDIWNEMLQIKIANDGAEDIALFSITLKASGSGNDAADIDKVEIYADINNDGSVDANDIKIGAAQPAYNQDNGQTTVGLNFNIQKGDTKVFLVTYVMKPTAPFGATYEFTVTNIKAVGKSTGLLFGIKGLPITSATKTAVAPPELACNGQAKLSLNPNPISAGKLVTAVTSNLQNCANKQVAVQATPCNFLLKIVPQCSCAIPAAGNGCSCNFGAPAQDGSYDYYACIDLDSDNKVDTGEQGQATLDVKTCKGLPALSFNPNPAQTSQNTQAVLSGLQSCFAPALIIDKNLVVLCAIQTKADGSGGSCSFSAPDKAGIYTYDAVIDLNDNKKLEANEIATSNLNVVLPGQTGSPGEQGTQTPPELIGISAPHDACGTCEPSTWSACNCAYGSEGTQKGICENNCGYKLVNSKACSCEGAEAIKPISAQQHTNGILYLLAAIGAGASAYYLLKNKNKRTNRRG